MTRLLNNTRITKMRAHVPAQIQGKPRTSTIPYIIPYVAPLAVATSSMLSQALDPFGFNITAFL